jgi:hypothetical protein
MHLSEPTIRDEAALRRHMIKDRLHSQRIVAGPTVSCDIQDKTYDRIQT